MFGKWHFNSIGFDFQIITCSGFLAVCEQSVDFFSLLLYVQVYKEVSKQTVAYASFSSFLGNCGHFLRAASVQLAFLRDKFFVQEKLIIVHDFEIEVDRICSVQT